MHGINIYFSEFMFIEIFKLIWIEYRLIRQVKFMKEVRQLSINNLLNLNI